VYLVVACLLDSWLPIYLKATGLRLGMLVNFVHDPLLEHERIVR
jgi:hypothetical protein